MISQREDDHVTTGLDKLTDAFKGRAVIEGMLTAFLRQADKLEQDTWQLLWGWILEWPDPNDPSNTRYAEGQQLDDLGAIVGQLREGRSDSDYIVAIKVRVRINRSKGRSEDMVQIANMINSTATYVEYFPLGWEVSIYNVSNGGDISRLLAQAKAAASYGVLLTSNFPEANVFKFDTAGGSTNVWSSAYTPATDKRWPTALPTNPPYRRGS